MARDVSHVEDYAFTSDDEVFFDTNVWLFIYGPHDPADARVYAYSSALRRILEAHSRIYIDLLVVSEFINTYSRLLWKLHDGRRAFKEFRKSAAFEPAAGEVAASMKCVLNHCSRIEDRFEAMDVNGLIDEYAQGAADFNDQIIRDVCRNRDLRLMTDDRDFSGQGISILTANPRLLG